MVRVGDLPGDAGEVIALHARLYAGETLWGRVPARERYELAL